MAESSTRKARRIKKDIISEVPRNIQETILCLLPIRDAVRTSILSRKWRHSWTMIPHLIFDDEFVRRIKAKLHSCRDPEVRAYKFVSVINKSLLLHNGPILKFSLTIPRDYYDVEIINDYIDHWIPLLAKNGIKQLILEDSKLQESNAHHFSSLDLTHLRLLSVWFPCTPAFGRFTHLTCLELVDATSAFGQSIFDCPVLEKLSLIICEGLFHTNFRAPNLKYLHQVYGDITPEYSFAGLENLTDYSFMLLRGCLTEETKTLNVVQVLGSLPKIEKFSVGNDYIQYLAKRGSPNRLPIPLPYLKTLNISNLDFTDLSEVSCMLCMIRSAPNLCELHIAGTIDPIEENPKNYWVEDSEDCTTLDQLKIVTLSFLDGNKAELELVKYLLGRSPLLKTMFINRAWTMKSEKALAMAEKMLQYSRASSRAEIRHLEGYVQMDGFDYKLWDGYDI